MCLLNIDSYNIENIGGCGKHKKKKKPTEKNQLSASFHIETLVQMGSRLLVNKCVLYWNISQRNKKLSPLLPGQY